jgi:acetyltransferase-like isoleucine patch superfamily enzyme
MKMPKIHEDVKIGKNFQCESYTIIEKNVVIGNNVRIGSHVVIKPGTIIEDDVFIDDYCISSGQCRIGYRSQIRYQSIIARNVEIGTDVFFCAGVKTAYLDHTGNPNPKKLIIRDGVFLGDNVTVLSGLILDFGVVVGAHSLVTEDLIEKNGIYIGCPAKYRRNLNMQEVQNRYNRILKIRNKE